MRIIDYVIDTPSCAFAASQLPVGRALIGLTKFNYESLKSDFFGLAYSLPIQLNCKIVAGLVLIIITRTSFHVT